MPIEVGIAPEGLPKRIVGYIRPGEPMSLTDHSATNPGIISVWNAFDDSSAAVFRFANDGFEEDSAERVIPASAYVPENQIGTVAPGVPYECDFTLRSRQKARLILTHMLNS